jgi:uncharacterized membrane protein YvlD (DUF360 family)
VRAAEEKAKVEMAAGAQSGEYGLAPRWRPARPRLRLRRVLLSWVTAALAVWVAAIVVPGVDIKGVGGALLAAAVIALLNALLPPLIASLRLPYMLALDFVLVLLLDAWILQLAADLSDNTFAVHSFFRALLAAIVIAAASVVLEVMLGTNDDDTYTLRVTQRIARRSHGRTVTDVPGILFLEIDGLAAPVLQRAMRDGHAPHLARWLADGSHRLTEWETDLSSQTGASQSALLLGSNDDIPAFRWVEKETGRVMTCSAPADCALIEERHSTGHGLLAGGGCSRGNLLSGDADEVILTISRLSAEKKANPGYRAFFANGFNVTRTLVLFLFEVALEWTAAARGVRRDIRPRGHRGGTYPFLRAGLAVAVRDLTVYSVLTDMMKGKPAVYACFAGYDEVAHHSGLERYDTLEVLRKIDQQIGRIDRARAYAARPYEIVVLSDHGQTQGATFKQRNGYGLDELVRTSLEDGTVGAGGGGDENRTAVRHALQEATGAGSRAPDQEQTGGHDVVVLGSGNLGLVYLLEQPRRLTLEEIEARHPRLITALREHPHVGWLLVRSAEHGAVVLGARGARYLADDRVEGEDPLAGFSPHAAGHVRRSDGFTHVADIMVNSFYDAQLDEGCAFEELISFHGGMGGSQTRACLLYPAHLPLPEGPIVGAEQAHRVLAGWRRLLQAQDGEDGRGPAAGRQEAPPEAAVAAP